MNSILVIEDSESYHFLTECIVKQVSDTIQIYKAYDGQEALEMLSIQQIKPDIILLDINMPGMDGHEFLAEHSKTREFDIPIVAMLTSSDQDQDKQRVQEYKFVKDYIVKPLTVENLEKLVEIAKESATK
jgi:CheY-like chemotaxis protein